MHDDKDEMALTLNGRKAKLARKDLDGVAGHLKLSEKVTTVTYRRFTKLIPKCIEWSDSSFLTTEDKQAYRERDAIIKRYGCGKSVPGYIEGEVFGNATERTFNTKVLWFAVLLFD